LISNLQNSEELIFYGSKQWKTLIFNKYLKITQNKENLLYSTQHKIEWVKLYYYKENSFNYVSDRFHEKLSDIPMPSRSTIQRLIR
jgi:hypothetical protein